MWHPRSRTKVLGGILAVLAVSHLGTSVRFNLNEGEVKLKEVKLKEVKLNLTRVLGELK